MSQRATTCTNPRCTCVPCGCATCACGAVSLGELERKVVSILWEDPRHELTGREVADELPAYAYTTILTVLDRLTNKGLVACTKRGRTNHFIATGTMAEQAALAMRSALATAGEPGAALLAFVALLTDEQRRAVARATKAPRGD